MTVKYSDIVRRVKKTERLEFAVGSVTAAICGLYAVSEFGISAAVVVITAAVCAAAILLLYRIFMRTDRKLRKMWEYVGSPD